MKKIELLAPAGDLERLKYAYMYGADAVYIGGYAFSLRANAINFSLSDIKEGIEFAHNLNKKLYVTVNIIPHNTEVDKLLDYLKELEQLQVDAIIVSDPYIINLAKENTNLEVHLSTQASAMNEETLNFYKKLGITRAVLARECSKQDIKKIIDNTDIEIECFIHGAMCSGISGRCVMSNYLTNRDANRGGCSQVCRWDFDLVDNDKNDIKGDKPFTFCAKDLIMYDYIDDMIELGIASLKIEGRMRSIYYIATVVSAYRKKIDDYYNNTNKVSKKAPKELRDCANRDLVPQFFNNDNNENYSYYNGRMEISNQDFIGVVLDYNKETKIATIQQRNYFKKGDKCTIFGPNHEDIEYIFDEIIDDEDNIIEIVRHPKQIVKLKINDFVEKYDLIRKI